MDSSLLEQLRLTYDTQRSMIEERLAEFAAVSPQLYFYELAYCLLTPQSSAANAWKVQQKLMELEFREKIINPEPILRDPRHYIRFHTTKSRHLLAMKQQFETIRSCISGADPPRVKRQWLADNVLGLSYKESTHFLRNIGKNGSLAILDRHILKHLLRHGIIPEIPPTLTKKRYLEIEAAFQAFADQIQIPVNALDLLFWSSETGIILK